MALVVAEPLGLDPLAALESALAFRAGLPGDAGDGAGHGDGLHGPGVVRFPDGRRSPLVHVERIAPRPARTGVLARPLPPAMAERLGVEALWSHQAQAIDLARDGRSVVVATGTASGKSLCYQAPLAEAAAAPVRRGTSLLIFPTKALAHDQLRALALLGFPGVVA